MQWAEIENDKIVNVIECEPDFAAEHGLEQVPDDAGIGWTKNAKGEWVEPTPLVDPVTAAREQVEEEYPNQTPFLKALAVAAGVVPPDG
jgi:hypothetical protein